MPYIDIINSDGKNLRYPLPEDGYHAEDVRQIAHEIAKKDGDKWLDAPEEERIMR